MARSCNHWWVNDWHFHRRSTIIEFKTDRRSRKVFRRNLRLCQIRSLGLGANGSCRRWHERCWINGECWHYCQCRREFLSRPHWLGNSQCLPCHLVATRRVRKDRPIGTETIYGQILRSVTGEDQFRWEIDGTPSHPAYGMGRFLRPHCCRSLLANEDDLSRTLNGYPRPPRDIASSVDLRRGRLS